MLSGAILAADEAAIGWWGLAGSFALVAVAVALSLRGRLGLERSMLWASARAVVQLLAVGSVLGYLLDPDRPIALATSWVVVMVLVAAITIRNRAPEVPGVFWLGLASVGLSTALGLALLFVLGIFPLEGKTIVPLAGMIVGNAMAATIVAARRILGELTDKRAEVEARLALGLGWPDASRPHVRAALRTALIPQIESTKAVGLVALPGAMTGLILAGVEPIDAVKVQAAVMFMILGGVATAVTVLSLGLTRRLFTPDHRLRPLERTTL